MVPNCVSLPLIMPRKPCCVCLPKYTRSSAQSVMRGGVCLSPLAAMCVWWTHGCLVQSEMLNGLRAGAVAVVRGVTVVLGSVRNREGTPPSKLSLDLGQHIPGTPSKMGGLSKGHPRGVWGE